MKFVHLRFFLLLCGLVALLAAVTTFFLSNAQASQPVITNAMLTASSLICSGTNGAPNGNYQILFSTNAALPITNWSILQTNIFDAAGNFRFTNTYTAPNRFYRLLELTNAAPPDFSMVGFATLRGGTTGGAGGTTQTVTTASSFKTAVTSSSKLVVQVSGTIDIRSISSVNMKGNKTVIGLGTNATLLGDLGIKNLTNVIVRNIHFINSGTGNGAGGAGDGDGVTVQYATNVWVDHCTFSDCADGECDITHASDLITVSWCEFYYSSNSLHNFVNLVGHDQNNASEDAGHLRITFHHNWWNTLCVERMPRVRFGQVHVFNNYANCSGNDYCVRAGYLSQVYSENNYYENIKSPYQYYSETTSGGDTQHGLIKTVGNTTINCTSVSSFSDAIFIPGTNYTYTAESPATAKANVMNYAGSGTSLFP